MFVTGLENTVVEFFICGESQFSDKPIILKLSSEIMDQHAQVDNLTFFLSFKLFFSGPVFFGRADATDLLSSRSKSGLATAEESDSESREASKLNYVVLCRIFS